MFSKSINYEQNSSEVEPHSFPANHIMDTFSTDSLSCNFINSFVFSSEQVGLNHECLVFGTVELRTQFFSCTIRFISEKLRKISV